MSPRLLGEAVDLAEAEPGAAPDLFGREEGIEDPIQDVRCYSDAGVTNFDPHEFAGQTTFATAVQSRIASEDRHGPALRHGIPRVDDRVEDGKLELRLVRHHRPEVFRK